MFKICECTIKKCLDNKNDVNLASLLIIFTPIGVGLPSLSTLLFNRPIRDPLPQVNRKPTSVNADIEYYEALKAYHDKYLKGSDTQEDSHYFPLGSTLAVQYEDGGLWMHGVTEEASNTDHNRWSYIIRVTKTGRLIMHNRRHIYRTLI